jgi:hypothetical protein
MIQFSEISAKFYFCHLSSKPCISVALCWSNSTHIFLFLSNCCFLPSSRRSYQRDSTDGLILSFTEHFTWSNLNPGRWFSRLDFVRRAANHSKLTIPDRSFCLEGMSLRLFKEKSWSTLIRYQIKYMQIKGLVFFRKWLLLLLCELRLQYETPGTWIPKSNPSD